MDDDPWGEYADDWDDDEGARIYARSAHESLLGVLDRHDRTLDGARVCDFGAGTGLLTELIADRAARIDAVDTSAGMLAQLRSKIDRLGWTHVTASADLPSAAGQYDLVVCSSVLSFVDDLDDTVASLVALLAPGGVLVHWDWEATDDHGHGIRRSDATAALQAAGLVHVAVEPAFRFQVEGELVWPIVGSGVVPTEASDSIEPTDSNEGSAS